MSLSSALEKLANYRQNNTRASQETFDAGLTVLKNSPKADLGDEGTDYRQKKATSRF